MYLTCTRDALGNALRFFEYCIKDALGMLWVFTRRIGEFGEFGLGELENLQIVAPKD